MNNVMERLLENMALIDYPKGKLEIQVLDDSTDESLEITYSHSEVANFKS
jgi:cellulose synthase/poly-beta-1,6-N-acetylglucosamine synthase-like glycosyltransferase